MASNEIKLILTIDGKQAIAEIANTDDVVKNLYQSFKYGQQEINGFETKLARGFNNAREIIIGVKETYSVLMGMFRTPVQAAIDIEQAQTSFEVLLGSGEKAKSMIQDLRDFAAKTPLQFAGLQENAKLLLNFGTAANDVLPYLKMLGDVSGGNAQRMNQLTLAFAQMQASGRLLGQDLLQMINAGFNPLQIISEKTGKSIGDLKKQMEAGAISSEMIIDAFREATSEGGRFFGMMDKQAETLGGRLSSLQDNFQMLQQSIGGTIAVGLTPLIEAMSKALDILNEFSPMLSGIVGLSAMLTTAYFTLRTTGLLPLIGNLQGFQSIIARVNLQMALAPAGVTAFQLSLARLGATIRGLAASIGPAGWLILGITVLTTAVGLFSDSVDEATESMGEEEKQLQQSKIEFNSLMKIIRDVNQSEDTRKKAIDEINKKYPDYIGGTIDLKDAEEKLTTALNKGNEAFLNRISIAANEERLKKIAKQIADKQEEIETKDKEFKETLSSMPETWKQGGLAEQMKIDHNKTITELNSEISELQNKAVELQTAILFKEKGSDDGELSEEEKKKLFEKNKAELSEAQRHAQAMLSIQKNSENLMLIMKAEHLTEMIALYKKFGQDTVSLENQRVEAEAKLQKLPGLDAKETYKPKIDANKFAMKQIESDEKKFEEARRKQQELTTEDKLNLLVQEKDAVAQGLGATSQMFAKHTVAYQAFAKAQALIDTYTAAEAAYKAMVGIPFVGPVLAVAAAAGAVAAGLARVEMIGKVDVPQGYAEGGRLKAGEKGFVEGWHNEIIAPEKTFVEIFKNELRPQIYSGMNSDSAILNEIKALNKNFEYYAKNPVSPVIPPKTRKQIYLDGSAMVRRSKI